VPDPTADCGDVPYKLVAVTLASTLSPMTSPKVVLNSNRVTEHDNAATTKLLAPLH
jgi:hypothetical protein